MPHLSPKTSQAIACWVWANAILQDEPEFVSQLKLPKTIMRGVQAMASETLQHLARLASGAQAMASETIQSLSGRRVWGPVDGS